MHASPSPLLPTGRWISKASFFPVPDVLLNTSDDEEGIVPDEALSTVRRRAHVSVSYEQDSHATAAVVSCTQSREVTTTVAWIDDAKGNDGGGSGSGAGTSYGGRM